MARDHALAVGLPEGVAALRLYRWDRPTLSLGRNEPTRGRWDRGALEERGIGVVRRPTGGRAVLHARELTYAVVLPAAALGARAAYRWINGRLACALAAIGVPAEIADGRSPSARPDAGPCFREAAPGELVVDGRKLVGSAQVRLRGPAGDVWLQHGSILIHDDQGLLEELGAAGVGRPASLADLLGRVPREGELEGAVRTAFGAEDREGDDLPLPDPELENHYRSAEWTWRR